jgi:hypothetical protein
LPKYVKSLNRGGHAATRADSTRRRMSGTMFDMIVLAGSSGDDLGGFDAR